ncbi:MAG: adenine phosphoribosyltransferase [Dermabacter sp.]|nr:adenine phosphoribosyltransferase [Dermabacter sp.]
MTHDSRTLDHGEATCPPEIAEIERTHIGLFPDWPEPGVLFRDITPLLRDPKAMATVIEYWASTVPSHVDIIVGTEARGFVLGAPLAYEMGLGFVPVRKAGKLPGRPTSLSYDLEYGSATIEIAEGAIDPGSQVLVLDDLLATGGTAAATIKLVQSLGADVVAASFLIELVGLGGRDQLHGTDVHTVWSVPN